MDEMLDGLCVVFANLKKKKLGGVESEGMVLCAQNDEHTTVQLMKAPEGSKIGDRIQLEGNPIGGAPLPEEWQAVLNPKRKIAEKLLPLLKTNDKGEGTYNGIRMVTTSGGSNPMTCKSLKNSNVG